MISRAGIGLRHVIAATVLCFTASGLAAQVPILLGGHVSSVSHRPIPNATVTASGLESFPAVTDSTGLYVISLRASVGQIVTFRVQQNSYDALVQTVSVSLGIPVDFTLRSSRKISESDTIKSLSSGLGTIDKVYRQLDCANPPCSGPTLGKAFAVQLREDLNTTAHVDKLQFVSAKDAAGTETLFGEISSGDVARLDDESRVLVLVYEQSVQSDYAQWESLSSQLQHGGLQQGDPREAAAKLAIVGRDMCGGFENMLNVLQGINIDIWDHYGSIRSVCSRFKYANIGFQP